MNNNFLEIEDFENYGKKILSKDFGSNWQNQYEKPRNFLV